VISPYENPDYRTSTGRLEAAVSELLRFYASPRTLLDAGCGRGEFIRAAQSLGWSARGFDIDPLVLRSNLQAERQELPNTGYRDGQYSVVSCLDVLEHLPKEQVGPALRELARIASIRVILSVSCREARMPGAVHLTIEPLRWWTTEIQAAGLVIRAITNTGPDDYQIDCWKPEHILSVVTPTGDRQACFMLAERWMSVQTYDKPVQWVVIDDGGQRTHCRMGQTYLRRDRTEPLGEPTLGAQLRWGLEKVRLADRVVFWEDDDWYSPLYLSTLAAMMKGVQIGGFSHAIYYDVRHDRIGHCGNLEHASLAQTAVAGSGLQAFKHVLRHSENQFFDLTLWRHEGPSKQLAQTVRPLHVGLKGMPGRTGIGMNRHSSEATRGWPTDEGNEKLREIVGADAEVILEVANGGS